MEGPLNANGRFRKALSNYIVENHNDRVAALEPEGALGIVYEIKIDGLAYAIITKKLDTRKRHLVNMFDEIVHPNKVKPLTAKDTKYEYLLTDIVDTSTVYARIIKNKSAGTRKTRRHRH